MPCPLCGEICRCSSNPDSTASPRWLAEADVGSAAEVPPALTIPETPDPSRQLAVETVLPGPDSEGAAENSTAWRQEVAARLNRYHSRRKPRPPRYPSLRLRFEEGDATRSSSDAPAAVFSALPQSSNQALALNEFAASPSTVCEPLSSPGTHASRNTAALPAADELPQDGASTPPSAALVTATITAAVTAKIIEFPRFWTPAPPPLDELAEPVMTRPRILEAPELVPPPPALGGITIDPAYKPELEKRPGIDIPLQSAPLARRMLSAVIDDLIIAAACALFGFIFWKLTAIRPPRIQVVGFLAGLTGLLWAAYRYLLVVYSGTTPGLRLARLELTRFDGSPAGRRLRRWRVLASYLSAASLGMGYGWVFLDEDSLCWHDRITHTHLAPKTHTADVLTQPIAANSPRSKRRCWH